MCEPAAAGENLFRHKDTLCTPAMHAACLVPATQQSLVHSNAFIWKYVNRIGPEMAETAAVGLFSVKNLPLI